MKTLFAALWQGKQPLVLLTDKLRIVFMVLALAAGVCSAPAQPRLNVSPSGHQSVLSWPISFTNYTLQTTTNPAATNWVTVSNPAPLTVGSNFTVTVTNSLSRAFFRLLSTNAVNPIAGMALIPAGEYTIGDTLDGETDATPANVYVSGFYMDVNLVTYNQWVNIFFWGINNGYSFSYNYTVGNAFYYKGPNYPATGMSWYDAVKWCNARSQSEGLTPAYYTDEGLTEVYNSGNVDAVYVDWTGQGYRLPTEAEWEKAARGGVSGLRFPWGDLISETNANYDGNPQQIPYDQGPSGYNPAGTNTTTGIYTTLVGTFAPNGYGLYDMAGNLTVFCWDWYDPPPYPAGSPYLGGTDPRGPESSIFGYRSVRNGAYDNNATTCRCANRRPVVNQNANSDIGFRCVSAQ
jgi:formylglycine-generating enzyme required for sulfatase activity